MAVIVKYVVERNGEEKMTFTSKSEADAYDKMLDMADEMFELLSTSDLFAEDEAKQEELSLF
ncbi:YebG family protein, partial [Photobacterium damselae]